MRPSLALATLALALLALPASGQSPAPGPSTPRPQAPSAPAQPEPILRPPPGYDSFGGVEPDQIADDEAAIADGFTEIVMSERPEDARTPAIRKEFIRSIEASVGDDGTHPFEWALLDLNGDGYNDLVIQSRSPGLRDKPGYDGIRVMVYTFNGKTWTLALNSGAMNVYHKVVEKDGENPIYQIASVQQQGYVLYEWDGKTFVKTPVVNASNWPNRDEAATKDIQPPPSVDGGTR